MKIINLFECSKNILLRAIYFDGKVPNNAIFPTLKFHLTNVAKSQSQRSQKLHKWTRGDGLQLWKKYIVFLNKKLNILSTLFAKQCNYIAAQRLRRTAQTISLYRGLGYDEIYIRKVVERFNNTLLKAKHGKPLYLLFGAVLFNWDKEGITDNNMQEIGDEMMHTMRVPNGKMMPSDDHLSSWEIVVNKDNYTGWRKAIPNSCLYEYKMYGSYKDIPAKAFYNAQIDLDYRKQWDKLVISLDVVDKDDNSGSEVIRWVTHFPYPMYSREYLYVRRHKIDHDNRVMVLKSRGISHHHKCPVNERKYVRVNNYMSEMVIKPHGGSFDENGFDYILTYYDDPKATFPKMAYDWMATTGVPEFVNKLHTAAVQLHQKKQSKREEEEDVNTENSVTA